MELVSLEHLVREDHMYRKFASVFDFDDLVTPIMSLSNDGLVGKTGYGIVRLFKCLLLQFMEDISDRELERFMAENVAAKWFCGFNLGDSTPDFSLFSKVRARIGTKKLSQIFAKARDQPKKKGYMSEVFTFVDASHLVSKSALWEERDKAIAEGLEKLNNSTVDKVAVDKDAKFGCKGKTKFWYGYKRHASVDMRSGLINKIAITPANVTDSAGVKHICPRSCTVFGDKAYGVGSAKRIIKAKGCHSSAILKNNMKDKNRDLDRWRTKMRAPHESVFSKMNHRARYRSTTKNQFAAFFDGLSFNMKRAIVLHKLYGF